MWKGRAIVIAKNKEILRSESNFNMGSAKLFSNNGFPTWNKIHKIWQLAVNQDKKNPGKHNWTQMVPKLI